MARTYTALLYHLIFSTKNREPSLDKEAQKIIFPYIAGIIEKLGGRVLIINGMNDHVHILCHLDAKNTLVKIMQAIKGGSSSWYNQNSGRPPIQWQDGYGAFTVSHSRKAHVYQYIQDQESHHKGRTFAEEYEEFLKKHGVQYDSRYHLD